MATNRTTTATATLGSPAKASKWHDHRSRAEQREFDLRARQARRYANADQRRASECSFAMAALAVLTVSGILPLLLGGLIFALLGIN